MQNLEPMKKFVLILMATLSLAACSKDDSKWIDGTQWKYNYTESSGRVKTCSLTLRKGGNLTITDRYSSSQTSWSDKWEYQIKSYSYDGDKSGTIELRGANAYSSDGTAMFTLNYDQKKMSLSTPNGSYTLDRTK
jgi:hypothetical protein